MDICQCWCCTANSGLILALTELFRRGTEVFLELHLVFRRCNWLADFFLEGTLWADVWLSRKIGFAAVEDNCGSALGGIPCAAVVHLH